MSSVKKKDSPRSSEDNLHVWYFENTSQNPKLLPPSPKGIIKSVSLGANQIVGLTVNGLLIYWQTSAPCISVS